MVVGTGYVGLVQGACLSALGHTVACVDIDEQKVASLKNGVVPFFEPGLDILIQDGMKQNTLAFYTSQQQAVDALGTVDVTFVAVQTPRNEDGSCNLGAIKAVVTELGTVLEEGLCVIKSTIPPGTKEDIHTWMNNPRIRLASNPEFLREGNSVEDFMHPDRIVLGTETKEDANLLCEVYEKLEAPVHIVSVETAQLAKYAANTMLASRLALINEIAIIADIVQADIKDVEQILGEDPRIGSRFLRSGAGFGGSCFPKDVLALADMAARKGFESLLIEPIIKTNTRQSDYFVQKFGDVKGKRISVWGLAFNKDTDDTRESPAIAIVKQLVAAGAEVCVYDPQAMENAQNDLGDSVQYADSMMDAVQESDILTVLTEWPEFQQADWALVKNQVKEARVFDGKNFLPRDMMEEHGLIVEGIGLCHKEHRRPQSTCE